MCTRAHKSDDICRSNTCPMRMFHVHVCKHAPCAYSVCMCIKTNLSLEPVTQFEGACVVLSLLCLILLLEPVACGHFLLCLCDLREWESWKWCKRKISCDLTHIHVHTHIPRNIKSVNHENYSAKIEPHLWGIDKLLRPNCLKNTQYIAIFASSDHLQIHVSHRQ